jgi:superfamily II DNA helicase RecQ
MGSAPSRQIANVLLDGMTIVVSLPILLKNQIDFLQRSGIAAARARFEPSPMGWVRWKLGG